MASRVFYLVITVVVLLDIAKCSVIGTGFFGNGKLWKKTGPPVTGPEDKWIEQKLDHFDSNSKRTFQQRYFVNEELVTGDRNVAFLNIGGEGEAQASELKDGAWYSYAKNFNPILFNLEHRYYGASHPTGDLSTENLKYLSSKQALADLAFFIESMNKKYSLSPDVKWIVFGGSYAGSLAAWARLLYPDLVHGVVSSSGPLLAKVDFYEYYMVVEDALRDSNEKCVDVVQEAFKQLEDLLNDDENRHQINEILNLCDGIEVLMDHPLQLANFFVVLAIPFARTIQYNDNSDVHTNDLCEILLNETLGSELKRLAALRTKFVSDSCLRTDYYATIHLLKDNSWNSLVAYGYRQWYYQTCTEFGFFQTSSHEPHVFGNRFDIDYFSQQCVDIYGPEFNKTFIESGAAATNDLYHGRDINVTNIVFIHGSLDPWHPLGVYETHSEDAPAILLDGGSHCSDLHNPSDNDSPQLKAARVKIVELISKWLKN